MNYFDLHSDTPYECYFKKEGFFKNRLAVSGEKGSVFENWEHIFAIWIKDDIPDAFLLYEKILKDFKEKLKEIPPNLTPRFAVEGGAVLEDKIERLETLKADGIVSLTLVWNGENRIGGGIKSEKGLTDFGKEVIKGLNRLKICTDLSHINDKGFYKAVELSDFPVATHSNCRKICPNKRNLTDEQLKLIAEKKGLIGICFYPEFLGENVAQKIYENVYHMLEVGLENNIAIGSDFDGAQMDLSLSDISKVPDLYMKLHLKGIETEILDKIFYQNAKNYFKTFDK